MNELICQGEHMKTYCATGHRPGKLGGYDIQTSRRLVLLAMTWLKENKPDKVISGMALGWDQAWAMAAIGANIPVVAALPFEGQSERWPPAAKERYTALLASCSDLVIVSPGAYEQWKMFKRNEWMVDNSDGVVALWNGDHEGGTYETLAYAERRKRAKPDYDIVNLWDRWKA